MRAARSQPRIAAAARARRARRSSPHDRIAVVIEAHELAIATSGAYRRGDHVADPHTQRAGLLSATVAGRDLGTTDAYATVAFAMGRRALEWVRGLPQRGYEALLIDDEQRVWATAGFPRASP